MDRIHDLLDLSVEDPLLRRGSGTVRVRIREGRATVAPVRARADLAADVRVMSEVFAGALSPTDAVSLGLAEGNRRKLGVLDAAFRTDPGFTLGGDYF